LEAGSRGRAAGVVAAGVRWFGRVDTTDPACPRFAWSGTGFAARFSGTALAAELRNVGACTFKTVVDGIAQPAFSVGAGVGACALASGLPSGVHVVEVYRQTEASQGLSQLLGLTVGDGALIDPPPGPRRLIEIVGDSISCGYGNLGTLADTDGFATESHWDAYPSVLARALGAEVSTIAVSGRGVIRNYAGDTADTMPMIYPRVLASAPEPRWTFTIQPQAVVINLGTNDVSDGKGDPGPAFKDAYLTLLESIRARYPDAYILCTIGPLTSAAEAAIIQDHLRGVVAARAAAGDRRVERVDRIAPQTADDFGCSYHPNVAAHAVVAGRLADQLRVRLGW
jgi:lysophospholipase L1-like esterase